MPYTRLILFLLCLLLLSCGKEAIKPIVPVSKTVIRNVSPEAGAKNTEVVINGENFGGDTSKIEVLFNDKKALITKITSTSLTVLVPLKAGSGVMKITMGGIVTTGPLFTYLPTITISTLAGNGTFGNDNGTGETATFQLPLHLCTDSKGNVFVADRSNGNIRKITPAGVVTTLADGFDSPNGICADALDNLYVSDQCKIKKISSTGTVSILAGTENASCGYADGNANEAMFSYPYGLDVDSDGSVYVAERGNHDIRKISSTITSTFSGGEYGDEIGLKTTAKYKYPHDVAIDSKHNIYILDQSNFKIKKIATDGSVSVLAGSIKGHKDGKGVTAKIDGVNAICVDGNDNLYFGETSNTSGIDSVYIRKISSDGDVTTLFGNGIGYANGTIKQAKLNNVIGIAVNADGVLYTTEDYARIRKIEID